MAKETEGCNVEWRVTVPMPLAIQPVPQSVKAVSKTWMYVKKVKEWVHNHSNKLLHCAKLGVAISLVSLIYYVRPLYRGFSESALGAILTAAGIFELHVGETLYKGFTETTANSLAAFLAVCVHLLAAKSGEKAEPILRMVSVFLLAFAATLVRQVERVKKLFEDGAITFIIIFILLMVSGYRNGDVFDMAHQRIYAVVIGSSVAVFVCMLLYPVWASNELHLLVAKNMEKLANSLDACNSKLFNKSWKMEEDGKAQSEIEGYKAMVDSKDSLDSLAKWARWEPPHGYFGFRHPWNQYLKIGDEIKHCASTMGAIHRCITSEATEASEFMNYFGEESMKLSTRLSQVLKELSSSMKSVKISPTIGYLVTEIELNTKELQASVRNLANEALAKEEAKLVWMASSGPPPINDVVFFINFATLLLEFSARIKVLSSRVDDLAKLAKFKQPKSTTAKIAPIGSGELITL